jgi:phage shock protein A
VQKLYPEIVGVRGDGILNLSYPKITAVLSEQVNRLEDESVVLKETIVTMRDELDTLKAQMAELIASLKR